MSSGVFSLFGFGHNLSLFGEKKYFVKKKLLSFFWVIISLGVKKIWVKKVFGDKSFWMHIFLVKFFFVKNNFVEKNSLVT